MPFSQSHLTSIASQFTVEGALTAVEPFGSGHINDTFACTYRTSSGERRYVLQRINHHVFKDPAKVMENIQRVTAHLARKYAALGRDPLRSTLTFLPSAGGGMLVTDDQGNFWRMCLLIENARTYDEGGDPTRGRSAARAFGEFQVMLADLPGRRLHETIPDFHNTARRFDALLTAITRDSHNRAVKAKSQITFALRREANAPVITDLMARGVVPERVTHNDAKLNNVMFDGAGEKAICVIDLDTVMPGSVLYDFGDMVRVAANRGAEDEQDITRVGLNLPMFEQLAVGYLEATRSVLVAEETSRLALAARLITFEQGIRFLTDYLCGDVYYKTHRPAHNLERARAQFALVADMERATVQMEKTLKAGD
jgi:aminoglycoside phosphotransferase (APT) family kinase protein